jgi:hypothetical protein
MVSDHGDNYNGSKDAHFLEETGGAVGSDHGCECKRAKNDTLAEGREGARWGQAMDATAKGSKNNVPAGVR